MNMNKINILLLSTIVLSLTSCKEEETVFDKSMYYDTTKEEYVFKSIDSVESNADDVALIFKETYKDDIYNINASTIKYGELYLDGIKQDSVVNNYTFSKDPRLVFYTNNNARVVNRSEGYAFTMPTSYLLNMDLSKSQYRTEYSNDESILTVTIEDKNPYSTFDLYNEEWLSTYIGDKNFLNSNNLSYTRDVSSSTSILDGYTVDKYDILINDNENIERPYYNIVVIRKTSNQKVFTLMVMKSKTNQNDAIDKIVKSYKEFTSYGKVCTVNKEYELKIPSYWSKETQLYYKKLMEQEYCGWGFFTNSVDENESYGDYLFNSQTYKTQTRFSQLMDYDFDILPTYSHVGPLSNPNNFPVNQLKDLASGNGFNNKPVVQFTLQFTTSNNLNLDGYTPMYDILRGKYDDYFKEMASKLKEYSHPVIFRLNNEMNSDWVSYCGMVSLLDPDIFIYTYERMANIFKDEGVDNVIYVFNPTATSYPYSSWGEDICYLPDMEFVNLLGLTSYNPNNGTDGKSPESFASMYEDLYEKNAPFVNYPAIISEFGCGAGGASTGKEYRNQKTQAAWVEEIFWSLNYPEEDWAKQIKGAVWFSENDYDSNGKTSNLYKLDATKNASTINAFKIAFDELEEIKNSLESE